MDPSVAVRLRPTRRSRSSSSFVDKPFFERQPKRKTWIFAETGLTEAKVDTAGKWRRTARSLGVTKASLEAVELAFEHEKREAARRVIGRA